MSLIKSNEVLNIEIPLLTHKPQSIVDFSNNNSHTSSASPFDSISNLHSFTSNFPAEPMTKLITSTPTSPISFTSKITHKTIQNLKIQFRLLFPISYPSSFFSDISSGKYKSIIAMDKSTKELVGFYIMQIDKEEKKGTILSIGVVKEYQNKKIGSALLQKSIEEITIVGMKEINLIVQDSNFIAKKLYKKFGFYEYRKIENYYTTLEEKEGVEMILIIEREKIGIKDVKRKNIFCFGRDKDD